MEQVCLAFHRNSDGSWTSLGAATIDGPEGEVKISPVMTFFPGEPYIGLDVVAWLEQRCMQPAPAG